MSRDRLAKIVEVMGERGVPFEHGDYDLQSGLVHSCWGGWPESNENYYDHVRVYLVTGVVNSQATTIEKARRSEPRSTVCDKPEHGRMRACLEVKAHEDTPIYTDEVRDLKFFFFFQAEDGIRDLTVTGVQTCALPI